jgi:hypothetical protein
MTGHPRYIGGQVWNRRREDEVLIDVHDVVLPVVCAADP